MSFRKKNEKRNAMRSLDATYVCVSRVPFSRLDGCVGKRGVVACMLDVGYTHTIRRTYARRA